MDRCFLYKHIYNWGFLADNRSIYRNNSLSEPLMSWTSELTWIIISSGVQLLWNPTEQITNLARRWDMDGRMTLWTKITKLIQYQRYRLTFNTSKLSLSCKRIISEEFNKGKDPATHRVTLHFGGSLVSDYWLVFTVIVPAGAKLYPGWCVHHALYTVHVRLYTVHACTCAGYITSLHIFLPPWIILTHTLAHCPLKSGVKAVCNCHLQKSRHGWRLAQVLLNLLSGLFKPPDLQATAPLWVMRNREIQEEHAEKTRWLKWRVHFTDCITKSTTQAFDILVCEILVYMVMVVGKYILHILYSYAALPVPSSTGKNTVITCGTVYSMYCMWVQS